MPTDVPLSILDRIRVASPCTARWEDMAPAAPGNDSVRHCAQCNLKVHDLSAMTREDAEALVASHLEPGPARQRLCARWRRRADGTIIFGDCPVGWERARRRVRNSAAKVAALIGLTSVFVALLARAERAGWDPRDQRVFWLVASWIGIDESTRALSVPAKIIEMQAQTDERLMGDVELSDPPDGSATHGCRDG